MSKAKNLLPNIVKASNDKEAVKVLYDILEALHLSESYTNLIKIRDEFSDYKENYNRITDGYNSSSKSVEDMLNTRLSLNFLYRDIVDKFSYSINKNKIFFEEAKSSYRADAMKELKEDKETSEIFNTKSTSSLRDIMGYSNLYREYTSNASISYGLYQELNNTLNSIRQFIDLLASSIKQEQLILQKDVK